MRIAIQEGQNSVEWRSNRKTNPPRPRMPHVFPTASKDGVEKSPRQKGLEPALIADPTLAMPRIPHRSGEGRVEWLSSNSSQRWRRARARCRYHRIPGLQPIRASAPQRRWSPSKTGQASDPVPSSDGAPKDEEHQLPGRDDQRV